MKLGLTLGFACAAFAAGALPTADAPATGRPFDEKTLFWIASMTKGFCGAAVMSCVDKGLLSLDDPIEKYIPQIADVKVEEKGPDGKTVRRPPKTKMTIRSLGLRQFGDWFGHDGALQTEAYANWRENRAALLFVQVTGCWDHRFKLDLRASAMAPAAGRLIALHRRPFARASLEERMPRLRRRATYWMASNPKPKTEPGLFTVDGASILNRKLTHDETKSVYDRMSVRLVQRKGV